VLRDRYVDLLMACLTSELFLGEEMHDVDLAGGWEPCRKAVDDYREANRITDEIVALDWTGVHWRRT
jgi:hypothetical protein